MAAQKGQLLTVVTGSRLHGLSTPESDFDYRGVFINDLSDIVNPFEKPEDTRWIEGETKDDTSYELRKFVKEAVNGNPNFIEILFSNQVTFSTPIGNRMRANAGKFVDSQRIFEAFKGYAGNQLNKMNIFDPDARTPKFAVAYIRSLFNGIELLRDGTITNPVPPLFDINGKAYCPDRILKEVKFTPFEDFDTVRDLCTSTFATLQVELARVFYATPRRQADKKWLTQFVREAYGVYS
jgi:predicted nucleotidyltransferase